jgi:hypothetical protein
MPGRPDLDDLLREVGLDLKWQPDAAGGCGAYQTPGAEGLSLHSSLTLTSRFTTRTGPVRPTGELDAAHLAGSLVESLCKLGMADAHMVGIAEVLTPPDFSSSIFEFMFFLVYFFPIPPPGGNWGRNMTKFSKLFNIILYSGFV